MNFEQQAQRLLRAATGDTAAHATLRRIIAGTEVQRAYERMHARCVRLLRDNEGEVSATGAWLLKRAAFVAYVEAHEAQPLTSVADVRRECSALFSRLAPCESDATDRHKEDAETQR